MSMDPSMSSEPVVDEDLLAQTTKYAGLIAKEKDVRARMKDAVKPYKAELQELAAAKSDPFQYIIDYLEETGKEEYQGDGFIVKAAKRVGRFTLDDIKGANADADVIHALEKKSEDMGPVYRVSSSSSRKKKDLKKKGKSKAEQF